MEFIPTPGKIGASINLTPEMICKNYPLDFLLQPIIPLLPPLAVSAPEEPSCLLTIPSWLKEACVEVSRTFNRPNLQIVGVFIAATGLAYVSWKLSVKWNEGLFDKESVSFQQEVTSLEPDITTEKLDEEVERIMSTIPEEPTVSKTSTVFSFTDQRDLDPHRIISMTSSATDVFSKDTVCSCQDAVKPIVQLHSRIDQVMSRVEDVISGIKALGNNKSLPHGREGEAEQGRDETMSKGDNDQTAEKAKNQLDKDDRNHDVEASIKANEQRLTKLTQGIKELEFQLDSINNVPGKDREITFDPYLSPYCTETTWAQSPRVNMCGGEKDTDVDRQMPVRLSSLSPPYFKVDTTFKNIPRGSIASPHLEVAMSPSTRSRRTSPMRNLKRSPIRPRPYHHQTRPFPIILENPPSSVTINDLGSMAQSEDNKRESSASIKIKSPPKDAVNREHQSDDVLANVGIMRQDTWPTFNKPQRILVNNNTEIITARLQRPETRFQVIEPPTMTSTNDASCIKEALVPIAGKDPHHNSGDMIAPKAFNPRPLPEGPGGNDNLSRPTDDGFCPCDPANISVEPLNLAIRKCEETEIISEIICNEETTQPNNPKLTIDEPNKIETTTGKDKKYNKLRSSETDVPPQEFGNVELQVPVISPYQVSVNEFNQHPCKMVSQTLPEPPQKISGFMARALSPFKRSTSPLKTNVSPFKRTTSPFKRSAQMKNNFQVKYIAKAKDGDGSNTHSSCPKSGHDEREDEWIVIVPTVH